MYVKRRNTAPGFDYALRRIGQILAPNVLISRPAADVCLERDVEVRVADGTILRVNVFLPPGDGPLPVIMCAHPYGKDALPKATRRGYLPANQYRMLRQPVPVRFSAWTGWESPIRHSGARRAMPS